MDPDPHTADAGFLPPRIIPRGYVECPACDGSGLDCALCETVGHVATVLASAYAHWPRVDYRGAQIVRRHDMPTIVLPYAVFAALADTLTGDWIVSHDRDGYLVVYVVDRFAVGTYSPRPVRFVDHGPELTTLPVGAPR